jgi:hypothetical protein
MGRESRGPYARSANRAGSCPALGAGEATRDYVAMFLGPVQL